MSYTHLSQNERYQIQCLLELGRPIAEIAARLGRHRSTIDREIRRNGCTPKRYLAEVAQERVSARQSSQHNAQRLFEHHWALVLSYLALDLSPQQTEPTQDSWRPVALSQATTMKVSYQFNCNLVHARGTRPVICTTSRSRPLIDASSVRRRSLSQRSSGAPVRNQSEPLSAKNMPWV